MNFCNHTFDGSVLAVSTYNIPELLLLLSLLISILIMSYRNYRFQFMKQLKNAHNWMISTIAIRNKCWTVETMFETMFGRWNNITNQLSYIKSMYRWYDLVYFVSWSAFCSRIRMSREGVFWDTGRHFLCLPVSTVRWPLVWLPELSDAREFRTLSADLTIYTARDYLVSDDATFHSCIQ